MSFNTLSLFEKRFSCRKYKKKEIEREKVYALAEAARLTPSSFNLEPWTFYFEKSETLLSSCFYQESMKTAPLTVVITSKKASVLSPDSAFVKKRAAREYKEYEEFRADYEGFYNMLREKGVLDEWSKAQCYIASMSIMTAAAEIGLASCAIEGFDNDKVLKRLGLSKEEEQVALVIAIGYPDEEVREKIREDVKDIAVFHY